MPGDGVLFYSLGVKCAVRLAVAMHSLRKHYPGPATVLHVGAEGAKDARALAEACGVEFRQIPCRVVTPGKNLALLGKCQLHLDTPYENTVFLDADTVTRAPFPELFEAAARDKFVAVQFADWKSYGSYYRKRIKQWVDIIPERWMAEALAFGPAINTGVFAFNRWSSLQNNVFNWAVQARDFFIPDEIAVCILCPQYPHRVMPAEFNVSCKYGEPYSAKARVIHYHGSKHARLAKLPAPECSTVHRDAGGFRLLNASDIWYREFEEVRAWPAVAANIPNDRQLRKNLKTWDRAKEAVL